MPNEVQFDEPEFSISKNTDPKNVRDLFTRLQQTGIASTRHQAVLYVAFIAVSLTAVLTGILLVIFRNEISRPADEPFIPIEMYAEEESRD